MSKTLEASPSCLKYAGLLGHRAVVVIDSADPSDHGRRVYAECPTLKDAMRSAAEDYAADKHPEIFVRRGQRGGWRLYESRKSSSPTPQLP